MELTEEQKNRLLTQINNIIILGGEPEEKPEEEFSAITQELLTRIERYKAAVKSSMTCGDTGILKGISIFKMILKELNPQDIDENATTNIEKTIGELMNITIEQNQMTYGNVKNGISWCIEIMRACKGTKTAMKRTRLRPKNKH